MRILIVALAVLFSAPSVRAEGLVNIRTNVILMMVKAFDLSADFNIGRGFTVGPTIFGYRTESNETPSAKNDGGAFGARLTYNLNAQAHTEGVVFSISALGGNNNITKGSYTGVAKANITTVMVAYQWVYESGFNFGIAGGLMSSSVASSIELKDSTGAVTTQALPGTSTNFFPEFSIGWIF
ncbi:MAG: hypothetical protein ABL958_17510 [Bdellovibrionia bacterium]